MNILHVLSQFEVTGAETYAASLIDEQVTWRHNVFIASDTLTLPVQATVVRLPIGERSYPQRLRNIISLTRLIRNHKIDLVHAHSRAASWVCFFAAWVSRTPFVSTVHGRQHLHTSSKAFSIYGRNVIAVCESVREHLVGELGLRAKDIVVIPNCIPLDRWESEPSPTSRRELLGLPDETTILMFVGRLTGPKGNVVRFLLKHVLPIIIQRARATFVVVGGMIIPDDIPRLAESIRGRFAEPAVLLRGFQKNTAAYLSLADIVIGSGRVVPEALAMRKPVIAFGESRYLGRVTSESFRDAAETNFGDAGTFVQPNADLVVSDLLSALAAPPDKAGSEDLAVLVRQRFDSDVVAREVQGVYELAYARQRSPRSIPVLMYHRVLEDSATHSAHGIWVTAKRFAAQLRSLHKRGFQTITFRDFDKFMRGEQALPARPIVLTFDDGYEDNYTIAFPLLRQYGYRAVIFVVTDAQHRTNFWDRGEVSASLLHSRQLQDFSRQGFEIGSHTVTHARLTTISAPAAQKELEESKESLEQLLGSEILSFAYPYGALDAGVKHLVEEAGYRFAAAADSGPVRFIEDFREIRRTQIFPWTSGFGFWKKTLPAYQRYKLLKV